MPQVYVVDAGVLFTTWSMKVKDTILVTTSSIMSEVRNRLSKQRAETMLALDRMRVVNPDEAHIQQSAKAAISSGDQSVLSEVDIELIALALMLKDEGEIVTLVSTDFAVLNTAHHLELGIIDPSGKFGVEITWALKCPACHYKSGHPTRDDECPVCGTKMRRTPLETRKRS